MKSLVSPFEQYVIDFVLKLRKDKGYSQEQIGFIVGTSKVFISQIENNSQPAKYNMDHVNLLADHFGISPRVFFPEKAII